MRSFRQILAIASTEFCFGMRRGWPVVSTAVILFVMGASILVFSFLNMNGLPPEYAPELGGNALIMIWPGYNLLVMGVLTMACAPSIPSDRQMSVFELLRSMPITGGQYLLGKLTGTVAAVLSTSAVMLMFLLGIHWIMIGPINIPLYTEVILLSGLPLLIWAPALGVIAAVSANKRSSAVFIGLVAGLLGLLPWGWFAPPPESTINITGTTSAWISRFIYESPVNDWIWSHYGWNNPWWPPVSSNTILLTFVTVLFILLAIGFLARSWLLWKENF